MYTSAQIRQTFARIDLPCPENIQPDRTVLFALQNAFLLHVPYENLDIVAGIPLSLAEDALFEKIVVRRRGGYCFELNGFLAVLLRSMGYTVTEYFARYLRGESTVPMRRHRVLRVQANDGSEWIVDVGIGQESFRTPLPYGDVETETNDGFRVYRLQHRRFYGWIIEDHAIQESLSNGSTPVFKPFYSFTEESQLPIDYEMPSFWCEKHPDSPFTAVPMLALKTQYGRIAIDGNQLSVYENGSVNRRIYTADEYPALLDTCFGIRL